jgi:DNA-binding response OmpR family regulator
VEASAVAAGSLVLVVEDEREIGALMRDFLRADGFAVVNAESASTALRAIDVDTPDCVLLDIMLPDESGFDLCRRIRERSDVPILFLSARGTDADKLRGLGLGADDYIVKSATPAEVVARIKAVVRRSSTAANPTRPLRFGRLEVDLAAHEVRISGGVVQTTAREFELLRVLVEHPRQVFGREQLFELVWGAFGDRRAVPVYIRRLREKLEANPAKPELITTVWGVGYRFDGIRR